MEEVGKSKNEVLSILSKAKDLDSGYERVLSSMCTYPHEIALLAHAQFIESNMGDPGLFKGTFYLEKRVLEIIGDLLHHKKHSEKCGYLTTGGTESNIQAIRSMKNSRPDISHPNIIVPESIHFSFDKMADLSGIKMKKASLNKSLQVDISSVSSLIDENTIGLVGIAGTTEFGQLDLISSLSDIAIDHNIFLHVDAAFGGFVLPFADLNYAYDFKLEGVTSITIDPHKMGLSTIPSGGLLFKKPEYLSNLEINSPYLSIAKQYSLTGTRSGAAVASTYAVMEHLGRHGYRKIVSECLFVTQYLVDEAEKMGIKTIIKPVLNIVAFEIKNADFVRKVLLEKYNWHVSITSNPISLRLVIMPHVTIKTIDMFLKDLVTLIN